MKHKTAKKRLAAIFTSIALAAAANMGLIGPIVDAPVTVYSYITINIR